MNHFYYESIKALDDAISQNSNNSELYKFKGITLYKLGEYPAAVTALDKAISLDPMKASAELYETKGIALYKLGEHPAAVTALDKAISLDPMKASAELYETKGIALYKLGEYPAALESIDKALSILPVASAQLHEARSLVLYELKDYHQALYALDKAIPLASVEITPKLNEVRALTLLELGKQQEEAVQQIRLLMGGVSSESLVKNFLQNKYKKAKNS